MGSLDRLCWRLGVGLAPGAPLTSKYVFLGWQRLAGAPVFVLLLGPQIAQRFARFSIAIAIEVAVPLELALHQGESDLPVLLLLDRPWGLRAVRLLHERHIPFEVHRLTSGEVVEAFKVAHGVATPQRSEPLEYCLWQQLVCSLNA